MTSWNYHMHGNYSLTLWRFPMTEIPRLGRLIQADEYLPKTFTEATTPVLFSRWVWPGLWVEAQQRWPPVNQPEPAFPHLSCLCLTPALQTKTLMVFNDGMDGAHWRQLAPIWSVFSANFSSYRLLLIFAHDPLLTGSSQQKRSLTLVGLTPN